MNEEEARSTMLTGRQVAIEIRDHNLDPNDFFSECGSKSAYKGSEVLNWLGY